MDARDKWRMHGGNVGKGMRWDPGPVDDEYFKHIGYKILSYDETSGANTYLVFHGASLRRQDQREIGYHRFVEESFILFGDIREYRSVEGDVVEYEDRKTDWCYFYRPPGWVHGGDVVKDSISLKTQDGPSTQTLATPRELQKNMLYSDLEKAIGPRGYVKTFDTRLIPWTHFDFHMKTQGIWEGRSLDGLWTKVLSRNVHNGAQTILIKLEAGYHHDICGYSTTDEEIFVLEGELQVGEYLLKKGCYAFHPGGLVQGPIFSNKGCVFWATFSGHIDFRPAPKGLVNKNILEGEVHL